MSGSRPDPVAPPAGRAALARRVRERLGPVPELRDWPPVSIVVLNRDGEDHLRLLLPRLATATDYPRFELVLVDNASSDGSLELARSLELPFPLTIVENDENLSFSDANDDAVERAAFDLVLFLNNDVEPFEPGWLKELVACLEAGEAAAVGATLLHGGDAAGRPSGSYVVQHRRVELAGAPGFVRVVNAGDGAELAEPLPDLPAPAATAACLLIGREAFERAGGFTTGFRWGWEDVDLGLKLASGGDGIVCSGRSVLFHRESSTRAAATTEWQRSTRAHNRRLFAERWGPQVRREYLLDRLAGRGFWTDSRPPLLAVALSGADERDLEARELADAVESEGWRVSLVEPPEDGLPELPDEADFVLLTDPAPGASMLPGVPCVAWVRDRVGDWAMAPPLRSAELTLVEHLSFAPVLEAVGIAPVLFAGVADAARLAGLLRERVERLRFCIKLSGDGDVEPAALALRRSLERRGHACALQLADQRELLGGMTADVAILCGEPGEYAPKPAQINVLWAPGGMRPTRCDAWDLVLVAGEQEAERLAAQTPTPVVPFDLDATADAAEPLLDLIARAAAREAIPSRIAAQA